MSCSSSNDKSLLILIINQENYPMFYSGIISMLVLNPSDLTLRLSCILGFGERYKIYIKQ